MAITYTFIASITTTSTVATVTFTSIPSTYTDLVLKMGTRINDVGVGYGITLYPNGATSGSYCFIQTYGDSASKRGATGASSSAGITSGSGLDTGSYCYAEVYIPNYTNTSKNKSMLVKFGTASNISQNNYMGIGGNQYASTSAISSIQLGVNPNTSSFTSNSTFYLYGIKKA